jgi:pimeloyl-ACP methyl ester carboxylesterase
MVAVVPFRIDVPEAELADLRRRLRAPARGGHFAALEQPELFVSEVRSFFRLVR